jgi:hypothetical protein
VLKKICYILLAFYLVALTTVPCGDSDNCNEIKHQQTSQTPNNPSHSDEICTPFCVCSCCAAHFLMDEFNPVLNQLAEVNTLLTLHKESKLSTAIIPIWQPPKLT